MLNNIIKNFSKDTINYGLSGAFSKTLSFLLLPFLTQKIPPKELGIFALLSLFTMMLSGLSNLGTLNSLTIFYFEEENSSKKDKLIWTNFIQLFINNFLLVLIITFFSKKLSTIIFGLTIYYELIILSILGLSFNTLSDIFLNYLIILRKSKKYLILNVFKSILFLLLALILVIFLNKGLEGYIFSITISNLFFLTLMLIIVGRKIRFGFDVDKNFKLIRVGFPTIFGLFAFILIDFSDRKIIELFLGLDELGVYTVAYSFGMAALLFTNAFSSTWAPFSNSYINKQSETKQLFPMVFNFYTSLSFVISIIFFFLSKPVIQIFTESSYHSGFMIIGIISLSYLIKGVYMIFLPGIYYNKKLHIQSLIEWFAAILNLGLNFLFIPKLGILGAALATLLSYLSLPILTKLYTNRLLPIDYDWSRLSKNLFVFLICVSIILMNSYYFSLNIIDEFLINSIISLISIAIIFNEPFKEIKKLKKL